MTFVAVLARDRRKLAGYMREQSFHITAPSKVESLLWSSLLSKAHARLSGQPFRKRALNNYTLIPRLVSKVFC